MDNLIGLYEKALPLKHSFKQKLECVKQLGFDFMEISIDESDERIHRLYMNKNERRELLKSTWEAGVPVNSMCFSSHRRFPLGSKDPDVRKKALELMERAIDFAYDLGLRVVQLAIYDEYYNKSDSQTRKLYYESMHKVLYMAEKRQVMLAAEIMDTPFFTSITKYLQMREKLNSPWFKLYPDVGNLTAWGNDVGAELRMGIEHIVGVHLKETKPVAADYAGHFKGVPFGEGAVDFNEVLDTLQQLNYNGPYLMEMWAADSKEPEQEIKRSREYIFGERLK